MLDVLKELNSLLYGLAFVGLGNVPATQAKDSMGSPIRAYGRLYMVSANPLIESHSGQSATLRLDIFYTVRDQKDEIEGEKHLEKINKRLDDALQGFRLVRVARDDSSQSLYWTWEFTKTLNMED